MAASKSIKATLQQAAAVFAGAEAVALAAEGGHVHWAPLAAAAVGAAVTVANGVIPVGPFTALVDAILGALGHAIPEADVRLAIRRARRA